MRRNNWKTISTLIATVVVIGCQDGSTSPTQGATVAPVKMSLAPQHPNLQLSRDPSLNSGSVDFTVGTAGGAFSIGNNAVYFPANSICDPATSSYGVGTWDAPCTPLRSSIKIHAVIAVRDGQPAIDFSPSLRFVPSNDPAHWVWIYMLYGSATTVAPIMYAPVFGQPGYDEAKADLTLRTYIGFGMGVRRIKHFSGYYTDSGFWCDNGSINNPPACNGGG